MTDPYVGKLCFFRVYSGTVDAGTSVYNSVKKTMSAWAEFCKCMRTTAKTLRPAMPVILPVPWA